MNRWAKAWQEEAEVSVISVNSVTPPSADRSAPGCPAAERTETALIDIVTRKVSILIGLKDGAIVSIAVPPSTDPVRTFAAGIVNSWLAEGDALEAQALRLLALTDLVAGLIRWQIEIRRGGPPSPSAPA